MRDRPSVSLLAGLGALGTAVLAYVAVTDFPPTIDPSFHQSVGQAMAQETLRHWKTGGTITAIVRDTTEFKHPEADAQFKGFQAAILKAGASVDNVQSLQLDPLRPIAVPPGDFFELIRKASRGSVLVSFMGPPELSSEQRSQLAEIKPAIVAFCPGNLPARTGLAELFEAGLLHAAIVDRSPPPSGRPGPTGISVPRTFEEAYRLLHASDAASLGGSDRNNR